MFRSTLPLQYRGSIPRLLVPPEPTLMTGRLILSSRNTIVPRTLLYVYFGRRLSSLPPLDMRAVALSIFGVVSERLHSVFMRELSPLVFLLLRYLRKKPAPSLTILTFFPDLLGFPLERYYAVLLHVSFAVDFGKILSSLCLYGFHSY